MSPEDEGIRATIKPRENGPLRVDGLRDLFDARGARISVDDRGKGNIALCRCGASYGKPFCDGTHRALGFCAVGAGEECHTHPVVREETPAIRVTAAGPYVVTGAVELLGTAWPGGTVPPRYALCRCGRSGNKPLCDGSHRQVGFDDPGLDSTAPARESAASEAADRQPRGAEGSDAD